MGNDPVAHEAAACGKIILLGGEADFAGNHYRIDHPARADYSVRPLCFCEFCPFEIIEFLAGFVTQNGRWCV